MRAHFSDADDDKEDETDDDMIIELDDEVYADADDADDAGVSDDDSDADVLFGLQAEAAARADQSAPPSQATIKKSINGWHRRENRFMRFAFERYW